MKPVLESRLAVSHYSRAGRNVGWNSEFGGVTSFVVEETDAETPVTLAIVAEGIGNDLYGEEASQLAVQVVRGHFARSAGGDISQLLAAAMQEANKALVQRNRAYAESDVSLGCMVALAVVVGERLYVASAGNCRIYLLRAGRPLNQLNTNHVRPESNASELDQNADPGRLGRWLGHSPYVMVDQSIRLDDGRSVRQLPNRQGLRLMAGDTILLASDGLAQGMPLDKMESILSRSTGGRTAEKLVQAVRRKESNATAVVLQVPDATIAAGTPFDWRRIGALAALGVLVLIMLLFGIPKLGALFAETEEATPDSVTITPTVVETSTREHPLLAPSVEPTPTATSSATPTVSPPSPSPSATPSPTSTETTTPTLTPSSSPSWTPIPATVTPTSTATLAATETPSPTSSPAGQPEPANTEPPAPPERPAATRTPSPPDTRG